MSGDTLQLHIFHDNYNLKLMILTDVTEYVVWLDVQESRDLAAALVFNAGVVEEFIKIDRKKP